MPGRNKIHAFNVKNSTSKWKNGGDTWSQWNQLRGYLLEVYVTIQDKQVETLGRLA